MTPPSVVKTRAQITLAFAVTRSRKTRSHSQLHKRHELSGLAALAWCVEPLAVIELVNTRLDGISATGPLAKLADAQINAGLVVGPVLAGWDGGALTGATARMQVGDAVLLDGLADVPGGDVRETLRALAAMIGDHCGGLQPGQIISTGFMQKLIYVSAGMFVKGWIEGFGTVTVEID